MLAKIKQIGMAIVAIVALAFAVQKSFAQTTVPAFGCRYSGGHFDYCSWGEFTIQNCVAGGDSCGIPLPGSDSLD